MTLDQIRDGIRPWIETAIPGLSAVIHARQLEGTAGRPPKPYAAIRVVQDRPMSATPHKRTSDTVGANPALVEMELSHVRQGILRIDVIGPGASDAIAQLELARSAPDVLVQLRDAGLAIDHAISDIDLSVLLERGFEERAQGDFPFRHQDTRTVEVPYIDSVDIDGIAFGA